jgi:predicted transposase/invertase (TIGR01784 family)
MKGRIQIMEDFTTQKTGHQYKDTLFRTLFQDGKNFLELYNAVADEHFSDDTVVTLYSSNEILARFNDVAAGIGDQLIIFFEHQSTVSKNMPLRLLSYATDILHSYVVDKDKLYGSAQVMIPTPKFYVLYNGEQRLTENVLKLSDAFIIRDSEPAMELVANVIDISLSNSVVLSRSTTLQGYAFLIDEVRKNQQNGMTRDKAITVAIDSCLGLNILTEFLTEHYSEVKKMLNWEYDADAERRVIREEGKQEGKQEGIQQGVELLAKLIKEGLSLDEALERVKSTPMSTLPS